MATIRRPGIHDQHRADRVISVAEAVPVTIPADDHPWLGFRRCGAHAQLGAEPFPEREEEIACAADRRERGSFLNTKKLDLRSVRYKNLQYDGSEAT